MGKVHLEAETVLVEGVDLDYSLDTHEGCRNWAWHLHSEISERHGEAFARRVFDDLVPKSGAEKRRRAAMEIQMWFMIGEKNGSDKRAMARGFIEYDKKRPKELQLLRAHIGESVVDSLLKQLDRVQKKFPLTKPAKPRK